MNIKIQNFMLGLNTKKIWNSLFFKEQFNYLKTTHSYHLVDPSPWRATVRFTKSFYNSKDSIKFAKCACWGSLLRELFIYILIIVYA